MFDGILYQSELMTLTLPEIDDAQPADAAPEHGENLAEGATAGDADDAFITIDLGSPQDIAGVEFLTRTTADDSATTITFFVTVDDGEQFGPFTAGTPANPEFNAAPFVGQVLRFDVENSTGGNTGAIEIRAFAPGSMSGDAGG